MINYESVHAELKQPHPADLGNKAADYSAECIMNAARDGKYLSPDEECFIHFKSKEKEPAEEIVCSTAKNNPGAVLLRLMVKTSYNEPDSLDPDTTEEQKRSWDNFSCGEGTLVDLIAYSMALAATLPMFEWFMENADHCFSRWQGKINRKG